jgi:hypothetical protein
MGFGASRRGVAAAGVLPSGGDCYTHAICTRFNESRKRSYGLGSGGSHDWRMWTTKERLEHAA